ncbi:esterase FE4-like [Schistocerca piceifrons]|uniref:esterase FE4-like n=1 Tax=Schistocerca piceifrons TaxID=274613 RepID=UPI001F5F5149|nr:esterase FE4-like [Schistocerca piceifrons]XP_047108820.1 esterase FE4-like [Schistocerca piceifrons]
MPLPSGMALASAVTFAANFLIYNAIDYTPVEKGYVTVQTESGALRGAVRDTMAGTRYYSFRGIPYAEPPLGDLRFQAPVPKSPWKGVRKALFFGSMCPQRKGSIPLGHEDCLYLNVYTPQLPTVDPSPQLPVMVFLHGGCFSVGGSNFYGPPNFVQNGVILVTINYRLGILGFLSTGDEVVPGNAGLKDMVAALRWVRHNIAAFGGDPENVTVFGQSAGAIAANMLMYSRLAAGLFRRVIAQSGAASIATGSARNMADRSRRLAEALGYREQGGGSREMLRFLRALSAKALTSNETAALSTEDAGRVFTCAFTPAIEPDVEGAFLTDSPAVLQERGNFSQVPLLIGSTSVECLFITRVMSLPWTLLGATSGQLSTSRALADLSAHFADRVGPDIPLHTPEQRAAAAREVRRFYYGSTSRDITAADSVATANMFSDLLFNSGIDKTVRMVSQKSAEPVFYYQFSFSNILNTVRGFSGASHADDLPYLFFSWALPHGSNGAVTGARLVKMWTNFAKTGHPTPVDDPLLPVNWTSYTFELPIYLDIGSEIKLKTGLKEKAMDFWHNLVP